MPTNVMTTGEYKGHKLLVFGADSKWPFQFGAAKAKLLLAAIEAVGAESFLAQLRAFVQENA
ncbi:MAG: hypothetical protein AMXMBFR56_65750 [Polyangiaceae bacterium]